MRKNTYLTQLAFGLLIITIAALANLCSCTPEPSAEEKAIAAYTQTLDKNTRIDLGFKMLKAENVGTITSRDSIQYYLKQLGVNDTTNPKGMLDTLKLRFKERQTIIDENKGKIETMNMTTLNLYEKLVKEHPVFFMSIKGLERHVENPDKVLAEKIRCEYQIKNPMLNNAEQTLTRVFYFDPYSKTVIGQED